jgi:hypothetical protein
MSDYSPERVQPRRLKNSTARSCFSAASRLANVPKFFRCPVRASFFREYKRNSPDLMLRIISRLRSGQLQLNFRAAGILKQDGSIVNLTYDSAGSKMTAQEANLHLEQALAKDPAGRYRFLCRKALVVVRLFGRTSPARFAARDKVGFRIDDWALTVEALDTGAIRKQFTWLQIESLSVGEPEMDNGPLFQG